MHQYAKVVLFNSNYFFCLHYLHSARYSLFSYLMFFKACFFIFYKFKWGGGKPPPHTAPLEKFLFKKENDNVCELKGGVQ